MAAGLLSLAPASPAEAVSSSRPIAIAVGDDGTSYVGFATGGALVRLSAAGKTLAQVPLDQAGPVDGLAVASSGNIWVDYGDSVSLLTPGGDVVTHFAHDPAPACPDGTAPASRYGGIAAAGTNVYVATRCGSAVEVYTRAGALRARVDLPSTPRGIAWAPAQAGKPARLFVALPDRGQVLTYNAETLSSSSTPSSTLRVQKPGGGRAAEPAGVAADKYGQLVVSDVANHALYFYDANNGYSMYRTLGHPPDPGDTAGSVDYPSAIAQHEQDGSGLSGNLFVADTRNGRVQRWDTGGYTFWVKDVATPTGGGGGGDGPVNTSPPQISGVAAVGETLTCSNGLWSGGPASYTRSWLRDGIDLGTTTTTYVVVAADAGHDLACRVTATNQSGSASATSAAVTIPTGPVDGVPANTVAPTISGSPEPGKTLTCNPGSWTGGPTYAYAWRRGPAQVATGQTYVVGTGDVGASLSCVVTATNENGTATATSASVVVGEPPTPGTCTGPVGVSVNGGAVFTTSAAVTLTIRPPTGATTATIANDGGFDGAAARPLDSATCSYSWTLSSVGSDRMPRIVYVRFGGDTETFTDDIVLDQVAPRVASATLRYRSGGWRLAVRADDAASGVASLQYAARRGGTGVTVAYREQVRVPSSVAARWVRVRDRAGNAGTWVRVD